jgi:hypothetical protein
MFRLQGVKDYALVDAVHEFRRELAPRAVQRRFFYLRADAILTDLS